LGILGISFGLGGIRVSLGFGIFSLLFGRGKKKAVIGYSFDYSYSSCEEALSRHLDQVTFINNVKDVCKKNDPEGGNYSVIPLIEFADGILTTKNLVRPVELVKFEGAWRHPCGGNGTIFGWELN
jgi:hypothetical protein